IRDVGEVLVQQAEERIGTEMFASFWHHSRHRNPQHDVIHERHHSHESRIVAFMFTKSQLEGWRDYWDLLTSGNCWPHCTTGVKGHSHDVRLAFLPTAAHKSCVAMSHTPRGVALRPPHL